MGSSSLPHSTSLPSLGTNPLPQRGAWEPGRGLSQVLELGAPPPPPHPWAQAFAGSVRHCPRLLGSLVDRSKRLLSNQAGTPSGHPLNVWGMQPAVGRAARGRQATPFSPQPGGGSERAAGAPSPGVPTWLTHGWQAWFASPFPASCLHE